MFLTLIRLFSSKIHPWVRIKKIKDSSHLLKIIPVNVGSCFIVDVCFWPEQSSEAGPSHGKR